MGGDHPADRHGAGAGASHRAGAASRPVRATGGAPGKSGFARDRRVGRLLRGLASCPRVLRLYPPGHQRAEAYFGEFERLCHELMRSRIEPLRIAVSGLQIEVDGGVPDLPPEVAAGFSIMLRRRRIRVIAIHQSITRAEIQLLVELLACDYKELLRLGGPKRFLDRAPHPHVDVLSSDGTGGGPGQGGVHGVMAEDENASASAVNELLEDLLTSQEMLDRLNSLRARYERIFRGPRRSDTLGSSTFNQLLSEYFERPEWSQLSPADARRALEAFLELLEEALVQGSPSADDPHEERVESLAAYFGGLSPTEVTGRFDLIRSAPEKNRLEFEVASLAEFLDGFTEDELAWRDALGEKINNHRSDRAAFAILNQLLGRSRNKEQYRHRRDILLDALKRGDGSCMETATALTYVALELPPLPWERREDLVRAAISAVPQDDALVAFTLSLAHTPELVYPLLKELTTRADPFPLLAHLLNTKALSEYHPAIANRLCEAARTRQGVFHAWARTNREELFSEPVFEALFKRGTELMGAISKDIIAHGPARDRRVLLDRLCAAGGQAALRLLVLGLPFGDESCPLDLLQSLARFDHPLAEGALREIVLRSNVGPVRETEAGGALRALVTQNTARGTEFCMHVVESRSWWLPQFRKPLRRLAQQALVHETLR